MKNLAVLFLASFISGCITNYDEPWVIEANSVAIEFPLHRNAISKTIRNSLYSPYGSLTKEQTQTLASALPIITDAVYFTQLDNWHDRLQDQFADADATFFYKFLTENSIIDEAGGFHAIADWNISPNHINFTLHKTMKNTENDGFGVGDYYYDMKIKYYFLTNGQGRWRFVKNEYLGFSPSL